MSKQRSLADHRAMAHRLSMNMPAGIGVRYMPNADCFTAHDSGGDVIVSRSSETVYKWRTNPGKVMANVVDRKLRGNT